MTDPRPGARAATNRARRCRPCRSRHAPSCPTGRTATDLFALPSASDARLPGADLASWPAAFAPWVASGAVGALEVPGAIPGTVRLAYRLGAPTSRDHVCVVCDGDPVGGARAAWAVVEALAGSRVNRFRQLLLGRARITVALPDPAAPTPHGALALLDATPPANDAGILHAFEDDPPSLVLHLHDHGDPARRGTPASGRVVESFPISADLHRALGEGTLRRRRWHGRLTPVARTLADHPDARIGEAMAAACKRSGFTLRDAPAGARRREAPGTIRLAPGRFVPSFAWRRLGATSLTEVALARYGAHGVAVQAFDGMAGGRTGTSLAIAEGALLARLGLDAS